MIRIKNIVAQGGYQYNKYLKKQLAEVMENSLEHKQYNSADMLDSAKIHKAYNAAEIKLESGIVVPIESLKRYTRITGALFDRWGMTTENHLTDQKIDQICALELGQDERTAGQVKPVLRNYKTVMGEDGYPIEVDLRDIKRGHYTDQYGAKIEFERKDVKVKSGFKKKTAIELVFSMDQSFSHASALMSQEDKVKVAALWMDVAEATYKECFSDYLKTHHGLQGETGASLYFHNDNRNGMSHDHVHLNISNLVLLPSGKIMAIEMDALRQKNFHQAMDAMAKNMFVSKWQEQFGEQYPVEAYDKDRQSIKADLHSTQEVENYRVAFTDDILDEIRKRSVSKELIDKEISRQKKDEYERTELKRMALQEDITALEKQLKNMDLPSNYGTILSHGAAPFNDDPTKTQSYFVELEMKNGKSRKIWSKDLEQAIASKNLAVGDFAGFSQTGQKATKIKNEDGKWVSAMKKTWEGYDLANYKKEMETLADLDGRSKAINRAHEAAIKVIESAKNRDAVWMTIKQSKKAVGKEIKDIELHKKAIEVGATMKTEQDRGQVYFAQTDEALLEKLTDTNPYFTKFDLIMEISKTGKIGSDAAKVADLKLKEWEANGLLITRQTDEKFTPMHTTTKIARQEFANVKIAKGLVLAKGFKGVEDYRKAVVEIVMGQPKGRRFNALQIDLMKAVIEPNGSRLVLCEGFPGTGKSTVMGGAIEIMQKQSGTHCLVLAPTGKVAASAGVDTTANHTGTMDKWLLEMETGKATIQHNSVIFVDEAGMVGTKNYNKFLSHIDKAVAQGVDVKVVLIGDTNQIQSVQAGNTYTNIVKDNQQDVHYLRKIIRQKDATSLEIAKTTSLAEIATEHMAEIKKSGSHVEKSWKMLEESGRVMEFDTTTEKNIAVAEKYLSDPNTMMEKAILCCTNDEIDTSNELVQDMRIKRGEIGGKQVESNGKSIFVGDRVMVNKNTKEYKNGDFGVVKKINDNGSLEVEFGEGKGSKIKLVKDANKLSLSYAISIHKSQGLTINNTYGNLSASPVADQNLWNVLQTRARFTTHVAVVKSEKVKVLDAFKKENGKVNLLDLGIEQNAKDIAKLKAQTPLPTIQPAEKVSVIDKAMEATKTASQSMRVGGHELMVQFRSKLRAFGKIPNSVFRPTAPPVAIIKQRQAEIAAKQAQEQVKSRVQVQATPKVAVEQERAKQAEQARIKKRGLKQ